MKNKILLCSAIAAAFFSDLETQAELRIWTDIEGKKIKAEHIRTLNNKVLLKTRDGFDIQVSLDNLSESDRLYITLQTPPRIDINVSAKTDRQNTGYSSDFFDDGIQIQEETVIVETTMKKVSPQPYELLLKAEIYVMGTPEQREGYIILDRVSTNFRFSVKNKYEYRFTSEPISLKKIEYEGRQRGVEYRGYLAAITDQADKIILLKCSRSDFEKNAKAIMAGTKGTLFNRDFEVMGQAPSRSQQNRPLRRLFPGRRF